MRNRTAAVALASLVIAFTAGLFALFQANFASGSVYPPYSTLRADPLGAKALFDSFSLLPGLSVTRNIRRLGALPRSPRTLFLLGVAPGTEDAAEKDLERMAEDGTRIVIAYLPMWPVTKAEQQFVEPRKDKAPPALVERLGVTLARIEEKSKSSTTPLAGGLPRFTALYFDKLSAEWKVHRSRGDRPVVAERAWRKGSLVLVADSWPLSNEALIEQPDAEELAWLAGSNRALTFDETHLGIEETGSIAALFRRYRLHGLVTALIALAALFVWSRSASFLPAAPSRPRDAAVAGRSSVAGMTGLLERSIDPAVLLQVCLDEWEKSAKGRPEKIRSACRLAAAGASGASGPAASYELIRQKLAEMSHSWKQPSNN